MSTEVMKKQAVTFEVGDVSSMIRRAITGAAGRLNKSEVEIRGVMRGGNCSVCEVVRYALAQELAEYLGSMDTTVKAVYLYEPEYALAGDEPIRERPNLSPGINLIIWASRKSAALFSVVSSLNAALVAEATAVACDKANALCWTADVQIVDDEQVLGRSGYGALIDSIYVRPVQIWHR